MRNDPRSHRPWARRIQRVHRTKGVVCHLCGQLQCPHCTTEQQATSADHLVTVAEAHRRGWTRQQTNDLTNLEPAHQCCNTRRGTKPVDIARAQLAPPRTSRRW